MYLKKESLPGTSIGNASPARCASSGMGLGPNPGDAMRNLYRELGVRDILLVEDDHWTTDSLSLFFRIEGCRLRSASTAEEAIEALLGDRFDLIICEYWLPDMDGLSMLKLYGNRQPGAVKVLISAYLTHPAVEEAMRSGIHEVIRKPFTVETLENSLKRHFPHPSSRDREAIGTS